LVPAGAWKPCNSPFARDASSAAIVFCVCAPW
jgi:hypothetical protein